MSLTEIEELIETKGLKPTLLDAQKMKSIQWADQWIGYDDAETFALKKSWASDYCFGGTMAWSVDYYSGAGNGNNLPLTTDGTCGADAQMRCGNEYGACCSSSGWCGGDDGHCGSGCQSIYGNCTVRPGLLIFQMSKIGYGYANIHFPDRWKHDRWHLRCCPQRPGMWRLQRRSLLFHVRLLWLGRKLLWDWKLPEWLLDMAQQGNELHGPYQRKLDLQ